MQVKAIKTAIFKENENLFNFILSYIPKIKERSVLVVTSKIVALSEGRTAIIKNSKTKENLIKKESELAIKAKYVWLTIKDGVVMASAGIDESNANGKLILLPKDSFKSARALQILLKKKYGVKNFGILITDSRTVPMRSGIIGTALGYAGFKGLRDYRKSKDIFGRKFKFSRTDIADSLAASAVLVMGEGDEQKPLAIIEGAPIEFCDMVYKKELYIMPKDDMYRPLLLKLPRK